MLAGKVEPIALRTASKNVGAGVVLSPDFMRDRSRSQFESARRVAARSNPANNSIFSMLLFLPQEDKEHFLNLETPPAHLTAEEASWYLGFSAHEIPLLAARGLLKPLGHPPANGPKYFSATALEELRRDEKWLGKASDAIVEYWRTKNDKKKSSQPSDLPPNGVALNQSDHNSGF